MLERVAVHQTRLRTPGLGLDAKGVALGAKGLLLFPSIDRVVAFVAFYSRETSLADLLRGLSLQVVRSRLGAREAALSFTADSSDRLDRIAELARLAGGFTFTGSNRHFVQYRDAAAPFGYDLTEIDSSDAALALYHTAFSQTYDLDHEIPLRKLLLRLEPRPDPSTWNNATSVWVLAEAGLGPALIHYFVRSNVEAEAGIAEWPPASDFEASPVRRYLFRVPHLPPRMRPLLSRTPGIGIFLPAAPGAAVEAGFRHPINLPACPVFDDRGIVLIRGPGRSAIGRPRRGVGDHVLEIPRVPALGQVSAFATVDLREDPGDPALATESPSLPTLPIALRILPGSSLRRNVTATWIAPSDYPLFRQVVYALGPETLRRATVAVTAQGAFVRLSSGIETIPVGEFFREIRPDLYLPAGVDLVPAISPGVLFRAMGAPTDHVLFLGRDARVFGISRQAFAPLEAAMVSPQMWMPLVASAELETALSTPLPEVILGGVGILPLRGVPAPKDLGTADRPALPPHRPAGHPATEGDGTA